MTRIKSPVGDWRFFFISFTLSLSLFLPLINRLFDGFACRVAIGGRPSFARSNSFSAEFVIRATIDPGSLVKLYAFRWPNNLGQKFRNLGGLHLTDTHNIRLRIFGQHLFARFVVVSTCRRLVVVPLFQLTLTKPCWNAGSVAMLLANRLFFAKISDPKLLSMQYVPQCAPLSSSAVCVLSISPPGHLQVPQAFQTSLALLWYKGITPRAIFCPFEHRTAGFRWTCPPNSGNQTIVTVF